MMTPQIANGLTWMIPNKAPATLTLTPDYTAETVNVSNAWSMPVDIRATSWGGVLVQASDLVIKVLNNEVNPDQNGRVIRMHDQIQFNGNSYVVQTARLTTMDTVWECLCRKEFA